MKSAFLQRWSLASTLTTYCIRLGLPTCLREVCLLWQNCVGLLFVLCRLQGRRCVLKDCCKILDNTVLPPETVVPPFTVFSGCPGEQKKKKRKTAVWLLPFAVSCLVLTHLLLLLGLFSGELPECTQDLMMDVTKSYYQKFLPLSQIWVPP